VIDLRSLRPLDDATIMASVAKTRRAVIVDEGWRSGSLAAEISARIMEQAPSGARRAGGPGLLGRSADPLSQAPRGRLDPAGAGHRRRGARALNKGAEMGVFTMPSLGADMEAGAGRMAVSPAIRSRGDVVAVVETQKGAIEIEIFEDGTVRS
jgi:hypothetical protein